VFRLDPDLSLHRVIEKISIPNGFSWSPDGKILYIADTLARTIYAYDYDLETGSISNKIDFFKPGGPVGNPDGSVMDQEGCLWSAIYGQGKVVRISPDGAVIAEILLPTRSITCPEFVDDWLYITSAKEGDPQNFPESAKHEGALFRCKVGVRGLQANRFRFQSYTA
jgi:sugar lactone lactonase YvrE